MRIACLAVALVVSSWLPRSAAGDVHHAAAQRRFERGLEHYRGQAYAAALAEFRAAYELEPRPAFLYNIAQAERLRGECTRAIVAYRAFLDTRPARAWAEAAQGNVDRCTAHAERAAPAHAETPASAEPAAPAQADPAPAAVPAQRPAVESVVAPAFAARGREPWYKDALGDTLTVGGALVAGTGLGLWLTAEADIRAANAASTLDEYAARGAGAEARRIGGIVAVSLGGALVLGGVIRYVARPAARERPPLRLARNP